MPVSINDIAKKTGYTVATVSRALNESPLVRDKTKEKIKKAAHDMGYITNAIARGLVTDGLSLVGIIVPDIINPYYPLIVKTIQDTLKQKGYKVFLCNTDWKQETEYELIKMLFEHRVKGIIMDPLCDDTYKRIKSLGAKTPVVFFGNTTTDEDINYVINDSYKGVSIATEYLISLNHKKIVFMGAMKDTYINRGKLSGYKDVMESYFGPIDSSLIRKCEDTRECGYAESNKLIDEKFIPTAIITGNDLIALGVIECFKKSGYNIPGDLSVIGFDDIEYAGLPGISLTTISEPRVDMGCKAAEILLSIINNTDGHIDRKVILEPGLIKRSTCSGI